MQIKIQLGKLKLDLALSDLIDSRRQFNNLKKIHIKVPSNLKALDEVLLQFNQTCRDCLSHQVWLQCQLALAEGFTNAVRHAHRNLSEKLTIEIEVIVAEDVLEIRIWDWGPGFDLQAFITNLKKKQRNWLGNGRGIAILVKISDHLAYYPTDDGRNCLLIVKKLSRQNESKLLC